MFKTDISSDRTFAKNTYLSFTKKYHKHYRFLAERRTALNFIFLYGPAGTGKTSILTNEFLQKFKEEKYDCLTFGFIPDNAEHNNSLFKTIVFQLLQIHQCDTADVEALLSTIKDMEVEDTVKDTIVSIIAPVHKTPRIADKTLSEITACAYLLRYVLDGRKACLVFDDIHLADDIVRKFFSSIEEHGGSDLSIVCTSRNTKAKHAFNLKSPQKWVHVDHLDDASASHFGRYISSPFAPLDNNVVLATNGNIYLIKELARLSGQKRNVDLKGGDGKGLGFHLNPNNITHSILEKRCSFLSDAQKDLLKLCVCMGFSFQESVFVDVYQYIYGVWPTQEIADLIGEGFLRFREGGVISFDHHITYEFFRVYFERSVTKELHEKIFYYYRSLRRKGDYSSQLARHALAGGLLVFSYAYYKKQARENMRTAQYTNAACCYEQCLSIIDEVSSKEKSAQRLLPIYKDLLSAYLILWEHDKSREISRRILLLSEKFSQMERLSIHSLITAIHWTLGDFERAFACSNNIFEESKSIGSLESTITAGVRCGSLQAEMGLYTESLEFYEETLRYITDDQKTEKFGLFVSAYPNIVSVQSMGHAELGLQDLYKESKDLSIRYLDEDIDDFTKLFITTHTGYAMYLGGGFDEARPYLELGHDISSKMKAGLLKSTADALLGICKIYQGDSSGLQLIQKAERHARLTNQYHKRGMIDLLYLEGLLLTYDLNGFVEQIDNKIEFSERTKQMSFAGWMYFIKAIYFAFYKTSGPGYIGAIAKANIIAETLGLKTLQDNIASLATLYQSNLYNASPERLVEHTFFDKAEYFYRHSKNVVPLIRH